MRKYKRFLDSFENKLKDRMSKYYHYLIRNGEQFNKPRNMIGSVAHEYIKGLLCEHAHSYGLMPMPEYKPIEDKDKRIDLVVFGDSGEFVAGFELDHSVKDNSIEKLRLLPEEKPCFIVSMGEECSWGKSSKLLSEFIKHIKITKSDLGF